MDVAVSEFEALKAKIRSLEEKIQGLRASRRILMNLLSTSEREKKARITRLERENELLKRRSSKYARAVFERNLRIIRLEAYLKQNQEEAVQ
jgi:hypothetical protein